MTDEKPGDSDVTAEAASKKTDDKTLNDVLASWDGEPEKAAKAEPEKTTSETQGFDDWEYGKDKAVATLKGDLELDDDFVETQLYGLAGKNPAFDKAFRERFVQPERWKEALDTAAKHFQKEMTAKMRTKAEETGDDTKGLAAAVHAAREGKAGDGGFDAVNWGGLSDSEFALKKAEVFRLAESGQLE